MRALYICYFPVTEPLVWTQVIPYLEGLSAAGHQMHLLTFETTKHSPEDRTRIGHDLTTRGITWHHLRYHKRPSLLATIFDVAAGCVKGLSIRRRHRIDLLHARIHVPAAMALILMKTRRCKLIFDVRGLMAEEYVDAGTWKEGGAAFRLTKWVERRALRRASGIVVLTDRARDLLRSTYHLDSKPISVIPSCVDISRVRDIGSAAETRRRLGFGENDVLLVYIGKFSTWYLASETAAFFKAALFQDDSTRLLVLTQTDPNEIRRELSARDVPEQSYRIGSAPPDEIGGYLRACDIGLSFIKRCPSKIASSPTKVGEYLAAGLPVISGPDIGDVDDLIARTNTGVILQAYEEDSYVSAYSDALELLRDPSTKRRCTEAAKRYLSLEDVGIPSYVRLYEEVQRG